MSNNSPHASMSRTGSRRGRKIRKATRNRQSHTNRRLLLERLEDRVVLTAGALDLTFGDGGKVLTDIGQPANDNASDVVAYQSDGKSVVAGVSQGRWTVIRYNTDGSLDTNFDGDGIATTSIFSGSLLGIAIDSQDRIVVAGQSYEYGGYDFAVARLASSGALDTTFDADGRQTVDFGGRYDYATGIALDSQDRIVVTGYLGQDGATGNDFAVARLTSTGALDTTFDNDGRQAVDFGGTYEAAFGSAVDSQDRIVVAGFSNQSGATGNDFAVARLTSTGALDTTFDNDGRQTVDFGGTYDVATGIAVDSQDRIVMAGYSSQGGATGNDFAVARLTNSGALDTTFDSDGRQTVDFGGTYDHGLGVAVDSQDRVIVTGLSEQAGTGRDLAAMRLTSFGTLDTTFDGDGKMTLDFGGTDDYGRGIDVDSQERIIVAVYHYGGTTGHDFTVARMADSGALDATFDGDGIQTVDFGGTSDHAYAVAVDSQDRIIVAGQSYQGSTRKYDFAVARLTHSGVLDTTFDSDGKQAVDFGGKPDYAYGVAVDNQGRVVLAGFSSQGGVTGMDFAVARLTNSGALDTAFDSDGRQTVDFGGTHENAYGVAVDSQGRIIVAGVSYQGSATGNDIALVRLLDGAPPTVEEQSFAIMENSVNGTMVGQVVASEPDGDALTFAVTGGTGAVAFEVVAATGEIKVADSALLDYETVTSFTLDVTVTDSGGDSDSATMTIHLRNATATISGTVFVDADADGMYEGGSETAIDAAIVELFDSDGNLLASDLTELGGVYAFLVEDELETYRIRETQPIGVDDGAAILGDANGNGVAGEAADGTVISANEMQLTLTGQDASDYDFAEAGQAVQAGDTATIGFWQNKHGQALIAQGGAALVTWLNTNFGNILGNTFADGSGGDDAGEVARFYKSEFFKKKLHATSKVDAQFMATALATFFTSSNLSGGHVAADYGFNVTETGIGTRVVNVGASGAAFGVANNTNITIMALLLATNNLTDTDGSTTNDDDGYSHVYDANGDGVLDENELALRALANSVYSAINESGDR